MEAMRRRQRRARRKASQSGSHLRPVDGLQSAVAHGNTDTVYCSVFLDLEARRPDRGRDPARLRTGHGQRRVLPFRHRHGHPRPRAGQGRQVPDRSGVVQRRAAERREAWRRVLRRALTVVREPGHPSRLPRGRQARRGVEDVPRRTEDLSAGQGREPAGDGVHQLLEGAVQHRPRQHLRVLTRSSTTSFRRSRSSSSTPSCAAWRRASAFARASRSRRTNG